MVKEFRRQWSAVLPTVCPVESRLNQAIVAFALLIGFVADLRPVAPLVAVALVVVIVFGRRLDSLQAPRPNADIEIGLLVLATLADLVGAGELAWAFVLLTAFIAGLAAVAQIEIRRPA